MGASQGLLRSLNTGPFAHYTSSSALWLSLLLLVVATAARLLPWRSTAALSNSELSLPDWTMAAFVGQNGVYCGYAPMCMRLCTSH